MARNYHEPDPFRYALGAFIQAARNVTWMLQKEKSAFTDFAWYREWSEKAREDPLLRWLHDTRNDFVKSQALEPKSWMTMRCIDNPRQGHFDEYGDEEDGSLTYKVSPFACTHYYIGTGWRTDHVHEFTRQWEMEGLSTELLEACAGIYDRLDDLVVDDHRRLGAQMPSHRTEHSKRALPCMEETTKHRVIRTIVRDGQEIWEYEPQEDHEH